MGYFKVKSKVKLDELELGSRIEESDFSSITPSGNFVQLEYVEDDKNLRSYVVKPGIWVIKDNGSSLKLEPTSFVKEDLLSSFINSKNITEKIDCFFNRLHIYKEHGIEVPKRSALLYGHPGGGKTSTIKQIADKYNADGETAIIIWPTDKFEAFQVKSFIRSFKYPKVKKLILIVEDIGGVEIDKVRMKSDSSLLSLLDNQEKTFTIPIFILATTNFPEIFLGNLTNRPGRFDDKIECKFPEPEARRELFKFFYRKEASQQVLDLIVSKKCEEFSPAHLKEVVIRSAIYDIPIEETINLVYNEIQTFKKDFAKAKKMGIGMGSDFED